MELQNKGWTLVCLWSGLDLECNARDASSDAILHRQTATRHSPKAIRVRDVCETCARLVLLLPAPTTSFFEGLHSGVGRRGAVLQCILPGVRLEGNMETAVGIL